MRSMLSRVLTGSTGAGKGRQLFSSTEPPSPQQVADLAALMPLLADAPVEGPRFHPTDWQKSQVFDERQDPDRVAEPWQVPQFVQIRDARAQSRRTTVEELRIPDRYRTSRRGASFARVVRGVMDQVDCAALIAAVNAKGFTPALVNIGGGRQQLLPFVRDGHRVIVESPELSQWLFDVIRPHLPERLADGARLVGLNERCRFLCYTPGQVFEEHCDGCYRRPTGHPQAGDTSEVTVQLYLHDVPAAHGGATTFFPSSPEHAIPCQPEAGSVLLFSQDLTHEGSVLEKGLKYTLRTEAMYTRR